jgi:hypothetical protein
MQAGASINYPKEGLVKTFKRMALSAAITTGVLASMASAASAVTVSPSNSPFTFTTGSTSFVTGFISVTCTGSTLSGTTRSDGLGSPPVAVNLTFSGCTGPFGTGATVTCAGATLEMTTSTNAQIFLPNKACTIVLASGCTILTPDTGTKSINSTYNNNANNAATTVVSPQNLNYTATGGGCFGDTGGVATWQKTGGGSVTYTQTGGTALTVT